MRNVGERPRITKDRVMSPIDFWASLAPWLRERAIEEGTCMRLKKYFILGVAFLERCMVILKKSVPKIRPNIGEKISTPTT
jgi:hypothetical protein